MPSKDPYFSHINDERLDTAIQAWKSFESTLTPNDKIGLIYHGDMDGLLGATIIKHTLLKHVSVTKLRVYWVGTEEYDFSDLRDWVEEQHLDRCIFADISIENHSPTLAHVAKHVRHKTFIFDHHLINGSLESDSRIILVNPTPIKLQKNESPIPTFLFAYKLALENAIYFPSWLLLLAMFTEGVDSFFKEQVKKILEEEFALDSRLSLREAYKTTALPRISSLIRAYFSRLQKDDIALTLMEDVITGKFLTPEELESELSKRFKGVAAKISTSITTLVEEWTDNIVTNYSDSPVVFIFLDAPHAVSGPVASIIRGSFPDKVIVTYVKNKGSFVFELRTSNDTHLNLAAILGRVAAKINLINYGGHPMAAGTLVREADLEKFLEILGKEISTEI